MKEPRRDGHRILTDHTAQSPGANLPAFLAKAEGAAVYHGFPLLEVTRTEDGWCFGAIREFEVEKGVETGDAFVQAPDRSRPASCGKLAKAKYPRFARRNHPAGGVYAAWFREPVHNIEEFKSAMWSILPQLRQIHERRRGTAPSKSA
jgi:hypothetical protein